MQLALTDTESGYYTQAEGFLGESGDFTTAPRRVPAFSRALARVLADLVDSIPDEHVVVVEVGAGEGDLAAGILGHWMRTRPDLRSRVAYRVDDVGERLRERLLSALRPALDAGWDVGRWDNGAAGDVGPVGLVVTNELLDAFPVHVVDVTADTPREAWVRFGRDPEGAGTLREEWGALSREATDELRRVAPGLAGEALRDMSADGIMELRPTVRDFLRAWAHTFEEVGILSIDYGDWLVGPGPIPSGAPEGSAGPHAPGVDLHRRSVRAYLRHQMTRDLYSNVGRQDLTADVDFRALAMHGADLGYETILYASLSSFLRAAGAGRDLAELEEGGPYSLEADIEGAPLASLLADDGVGGMFKVMLQVRDRGGT
jgi:SAM-dependent MidA family methyltransferase